MKRVIFALSVSIIGSMFMVQAALATGLGVFKNFSADVEATSADGTITSASKMYSKDGKRRIEHSAGAREIINIVRPDKKLVWMLRPDRNTYMEMSLDSRKQDVLSQLHDPSIKTDKEFLGNDTVDNHPTKKYHLTIIREGKKETSGFIWEAIDLDNFPVKYQNEKRTATILWKNIKFENVPDSLFEIPVGYKKIEMPTRGMDNPAIPGR